MEPLSLDNFIIGHWRKAVHGRRGASSSATIDRYKTILGLGWRRGGGGGGIVLSMMGIVLSSSFLWVFVGTDIMAHIENST